MLQTVPVKEEDEKIGVIYLVSMFPVWDIVPNCQRMHFL